MTHQSTRNWYKSAIKDSSKRQSWDKGIEKAISLLKEAGVKYECLTEKIGKVHFLFDDKIKYP